MIKPLLFWLVLLFIPLTISAQGIRITEKKVEEVLVMLEDADVEILELKTLRKYKALNLSNDMKSKMDYNIVRVKYMANGKSKTVIIDRNLVPIRYDYLDLLE
jgi:hypothetical protein